MSDDQMFDPRVLGAPPVLRARFSRLLKNTRLTAVARELELDRVEMTTQLLEHLRGANGWGDDERVASNVALAALIEFNKLGKLSKESIIPRLGTYPESSEMMRGVRELAIAVLEGKPV